MNHLLLKHVLDIAALLLSCCLVIFVWSPNPYFSDAGFWIPYAIIVLFVAPSLLALVISYFEAWPRLSLHAIWGKSSEHEPWRPNLRNTTLTAAMTAIITPILLLRIWKAELQMTETVVTKDEVVSQAPGPESALRHLLTCFPLFSPRSTTPPLP